MSSFDLLHPSMQHHIVNTLGWNSLRPLQEATIEPILNGEHALLLAPTAGGKTEAASFPVISRVANERLAPLSVLYLAPLKALINNLLPRLEQYSGFVGRTAALWHGDVGPGDRNAILSDPPDILLTTPESLEAMLISSRVDPGTFFKNLHTVVIDEVHAFASDDRGWHMLAVLERLSKLCGRELQRLGLSATVGNPDDLLEWLTQGVTAKASVLAPPAAAVTEETDVQVDFVGGLQNAATIISSLHRGEKRLVFVDSRARAEELTSHLIANDVQTFVSHGSLGKEQRQRTEQAFAESSNCVIVATSTLELGIDIGDLDRVIQIDAPNTVASFLQRIGRTGRRTGTVRNALFLATDDEAFDKQLGLLRLWKNDFVEPVVGPAFPAHLFAQQVMALTLQEPGQATDSWKGWLGEPNVFGSDVKDKADELMAYMLDNNILFVDEGHLSMGDRGEETFGRRHFMDLMSAFTSEPVFHVRAGRSEIGLVPDAALAAAEANEGRMLLAGRHWFIEAVDFRRRVITVSPAPDGGKIRFWGTAQPLSFELCQSIRSVLVGDNPGIELSERAERRLAERRSEMNWLGTASAGPFVQHTERRSIFWTFAGIKANLELAARLSSVRSEGGMIDNFMLPVDQGTTTEDCLRLITSMPAGHQEFIPHDRMVEGLKFHEALPRSLALQVAQRRLADFDAVASTTG